MNRQTAVGALNDTIKREGSGNEERPRRTKSNKSLNPTPRQQFFHGCVIDCVGAARSARVISSVGRLRPLHIERNYMNDPQSLENIQDGLLEMAKEVTGALSPQWEARKDIAKTLITLSSGALVFTITFAASLIKPTTSALLRSGVIVCWIAFICSLIFSLLSLWCSIGLHDFQGLLMTKSTRIREMLEENRESLPTLTAETWKEIVRDDKISRRLLRASIICYGIALIIFIVIGVRQFIS
jgi:hypothetical protein